MLKLDPWEKLKFSKPQEWPAWKQCFDHFRCVMKVNKENEELQINSPIYTMDKEAEHIFSSFMIEEQQEKKCEALLMKFEEYYSQASMFSLRSTEGWRKCGSLFSKLL